MSVQPSLTPQVPVIPESAPFSPEQRAWLNGFIAGLLSHGPAVSAPTSVNATPLRPVTILFGSQTGGAEALAQRTAKIASSRGFVPTVLDMGQTPASRLLQEENVLVITSTYGDGEPPDNARALHAELHAPAAPSLGKLRFSVLGLGDTNYLRFCQSAKDFDARLEALGGIRVARRVDCDLDYESQYLSWIERALTALGSVSDSGLEPAETVGAPSPPTAAAGYDRLKPYPAPVLQSQRLNGDSSAKRVHHVAFALGDSGLVYEPGDALGVWPHNCPELVGTVLQALGCDGEEEVRLADGTTLSLRKALAERCDLGRPSAELAARFGAPGDHVAPSPHVLDLLKLRPECRLAPADFIRLLRPLAPRLYSISSSPRAHPGEVHLTVGVVGYDAFGRARKGVCSTFLADRASLGEGRSGIFVHRNPAFRLPASSDTPIIMVGPGTGIAPFRSFLAERQAQGAKGGSWLFFGDQRAECDFLYREEIGRFQSSGTLHRLSTAFSRDQEAKVYVQHRMREQAQELYAWLENGASFYVCGDAARMAKDVDAALHEIVMTASGRNRTQAEDYIQALRTARRYQRDVY